MTTEVLRTHPRTLPVNISTVSSPDTGEMENNITGDIVKIGTEVNMTLETITTGGEVIMTGELTRTGGEVIMTEDTTRMKKEA